MTNYWFSWIKVLKRSKSINYVIFFIYLALFSITGYSKDIKEDISDFYKNYVGNIAEKQDFKINQFFKKLEESVYMLYLKNYNNIEFYEAKINIEPYWVVEKLNFIKMGGYEVLSPEPKFPRDYFKKKVGINYDELEFCIRIEEDKFNLDFNRFIFNGKANISDFSIQIGYNLFTKFENFKDLIKNKNQNIFYKILIYSYLSPLNTSNREIKIFGIIKEFQKNIN